MISHAANLLLIESIGLPSTIRFPVDSLTFNAQSTVEKRRKGRETYSLVTEGTQHC